MITTLITSKLLQDSSDVEGIINYAISKGRGIAESQGSDISDFDKYLDKNITVDDLHLSISPRGYVFKTLGSAIYCLRQAKQSIDRGENPLDIFRRLLLLITMEAGDADTNCAVVGAMLDVI